jgi:uncharacterized protein (TIGR02466 family)
MLAWLEPFIASHAATNSDHFAWTGDRRGCWKLHGVEEFRWIRRQVERRTIEFARALGVNLAAIGFYFQRSWPVLSRPGEQVGRHAHPNASLSAVYFLKTPVDRASAGQLVFHNDAEQSSLGKGFAGPDTRGIGTWNEFNYPHVHYEPVEGRLILFPSRQAHSVGINQTDELRISLSFDIALTCSRHADPGRHEFLLPPPEEWNEFSSQVEDPSDG